MPNKEQKLLIAVFLLYIITLVFFIPHHEHWADEAQSWLLARDSGLKELLWKNLRYEGTPGLWHLILMLPSRLFSYNILSYISGGIATVGIGILLYKSPFPLWMKLLLPFTYFLCFQYGIVARSYVLLIPLLFGIAAIYEQKWDRPWLFIVLIVLLTNVSLHGSLMAFAIMLDQTIELLKSRKHLQAKQWIGQGMLYGLFLACGLFIIFQLKPPPNLSFSPTGFEFDRIHFKQLSVDVWSSVLTERRWLSYPILIITLIWLMITRKIILFVLGSLLLLVLFSLYYNAWHQGSLFLFWLFVLWLSYDDSRYYELSFFVKPLMNAAILITIGFHVYWNVVALQNDYKGQYSAGEAVAQYITDNHYQDKNIFAYHFWPVAIQPYFPQNIFTDSRYFNNNAYWVWNTENEYPDELTSVLAKQPDMIIFSKPNLYPVPEAEPPYQKVEQSFIGEVYWKAGIQEYVEFVIWVRE
ncbi:MAG: hypothetical protein R2730_07560 [Chitinophagales bacterium]